MSAAYQSNFVSPLASVLNKARDLGYEIPSTQTAYVPSSVLQKLKELNQLRVDASNLSAELVRYENVQKGEENNGYEDIRRMEVALTAMLTHIEKILRFKDYLSSYLQQPHAGDHFVVEIDHQADVQMLFQKMVETINNVPRYVEALEWAARVKLDDDTIEKKFGGLSSMLARAQRYHDALTDLRNALSSLAPQ